jgi:hypothetical protein
MKKQCIIISKLSTTTSIIDNLNFLTKTEYSDLESSAFNEAVIKAVSIYGFEIMAATSDIRVYLVREAKE